MDLGAGMRGEHEPGDDDGLAAFFVARGPALLRLAWLLTADARAAEDLLQDALVRAIPKWAQVEPPARERYLRAAIRSTWIDGWRRSGQGRFAVFPAADLSLVADRADDDPGVEGFADRDALAAALAELAPGQRAVIVLRFCEDQTERQTAAALGCSVGTVKSQTHAGLARLRSIMHSSRSGSGPEAEVTR
jgi:RNA polymerase sigma-70 factor (sigma-E family)